MKRNQPIHFNGGKIIPEGVAAIFAKEPKI